MFCSECGTQIPDNAKFCASCGTNIENQTAEQRPQEQNAPSTESPQPTTSPIAAQPKPTWKKVVTWAFLFIVGVIALASITTSGLMEPVEAHLTALRNGDIESAYTHTSRDIRTSTPLAAFQKFVAAYPALTRHTIFSMDERSFEGSEGRVKGHLLMNDKKIAHIEFLMSEEEDEWMIQGMELKAPE